MTDHVNHQMYIQDQFLTPQACADLVKSVNEEGEWREYVDPANYIGHAVKQSFIDFPADHPWHDEFYLRIHELNEATWQFDLTGWQQPLRVARYLPGHLHDWHVDYTIEDRSKLAFSIPLNGMYRGGELQILETPQIKQVIGRAVIFPAFYGHRVTKLTRGTRYVLLGWLTGPRFK